MKWTRFFERSHWDRERSRELDSYLEIETDENIARGMPVEDARRAAQRKLGNSTRVREEIYQMNSIRFLETLGQDLRYAGRMLRRSPAFTLLAVLSLALGIGGNAAMFTLVDGVLLQPLPYPDPNRLLRVTDYYPQGALVALQQRSRTMGVAGFSTDSQFNGVVSYSAAQRTFEIGVRVALGATRSSVFGLVLQQSIRLVLTGLAVGVVVCLAVTRTLNSFLYGTTSTDPLTFLGVGALLLAIALLAGYVPARRAAAVDPLRALRVE